MNPASSVFGAPSDPSAIDAYRRYLHAFFARWSPLYDAFAAPIAWVYEAAARAAAPGTTVAENAGRTVLDLCTGTGELAFRAARRGARVTAIDFTRPMLARARAKAAEKGKRGRADTIRWLEMDARRLAFPDRSFDVVVFSFALHDMPQKVRRRALREARRVAREAVVILDYETSRRRWLAAPVEATLASFETAYLHGFLLGGGVGGALADARLPAERISRPLPGWFALWRSPVAESQ